MGDRGEPEDLPEWLLLTPPSDLIMERGLPVLPNLTGFLEIWIFFFKLKPTIQEMLVIFFFFNMKISPFRLNQHFSRVSP